MKAGHFETLCSKFERFQKDNLWLDWLGKCLDHIDLKMVTYFGWLTRIKHGEPCTEKQLEIGSLSTCQNHRSHWLGQINLVINFMTIFF